MTLTDILDTLSSRANSDAAVIAQDYIDGVYESIDEAAQVLADHVRAFNQTGVAVGEAACRDLLATLEATAGTVATSATAHFDDLPRLAKGAKSALANEETAVMAAGRFAASEAIEAAQTSFGKTMATTQQIHGWRRGLEGEACQLCTWWSREERVWPKDYPIQTHKGCTCRQIPVKIAASDFKTVTDRSWRAAQERAANQPKENTND